MSRRRKILIGGHYIQTLELMFGVTVPNPQDEYDSAGKCWHRSGLSSIWSRIIILLDHKVNSIQKELGIQFNLNFKDYEYCQEVSFEKRRKIHFYSNLRNYR